MPVEDSFGLFVHLKPLQPEVRHGVAISLFAYRALLFSDGDNGRHRRKALFFQHFTMGLDLPACQLKYGEFRASPDIEELCRFFSPSAARRLMGVGQSGGLRTATRVESSSRRFRGQDCCLVSWSSSVASLPPT